MSVSGQSASSFGSGVDSENGSTAGGPPNANDNDGSEDTNTLESGLFGVLYTVSKEKNPALWFVAFRLFLDWIQVFLLLVNPQYGWNINPNNKVWQAFSFIQLNYFMSTRGYTFFLVCMYIFACALAVNLGLCIWVSNSFKHNKFDHVWPIVWLRYFSLVFYQVLDIASLTLFLMTMDCGYFPSPTQGYNQEFPDVYCWSMPHMIHVAVAAAACVVFFLLASVFSMAEIELNPVSRNLMGMAHTRVELQGFAVKMFMTCVSVFINATRWMSVFQLIGSFFLCYLYLRWLPHLHAGVNHVRVATYFSVFWAALLYIIMAYQPGVNTDDPDAVRKQQNQITIALWAGFIPFGLLGGGLSWWRTRFFMRTVAGRFRDAPASAKSKNIFKFEDCREVEMTSRVCRQWVDEETLDDSGVALAERIVRAGVQQLPRSPYMAIWWSSFLIDVQGSYQSGYGALQDAKKMPNASFLERFCIFIREQEHTQKASAASSGDNASIDLVSYVEFQRNYRLAMRLHYEALMAKKGFWETLLHNQVTFNKLADSVQRIEETVRAAEKMYRQVLARHSNSVKILVLYVKFLQNVRNDPWSAARWSVEAEKLQRMEEEANEKAVFGDQNGMQNHDDSKGVIVIGANCLIRMVNEAAANMLGYSQRAELVGKNVNVVVPPPFSRNHNNYVRNYIQTGQAKILDGVREAVALHKDRYVLPVNLYVTKVSGIGEDSVFMGIVQGLPATKDTATVWLLNNGSVMSCDGEFTDWLGYKHEDIHGRHITDLVENKDVFENLLNTVRIEHAELAKRKPAHNVQEANAVVSSSQQPSWPAYSVVFKHLYLDLFISVDVSVKVGGITDTAIYSCRMTRREDTSHMLMVTDVKGRVTHMTRQLADKLGTTVSKVQAGNMAHALDALLPPPFMRIHHQWYKDKAEVPPAWSCRSGLPMVFTTPTAEGPKPTPFTLHFARKDLPGKEALNLIRFEQCTPEQALDARRLSLVLNSQGVVTSVGDSPASLYGFEPQALIGMHLLYVIDILCPPATKHSPTDKEVLDSEALATKLLMQMAERSYDHPGMSWRVGVRAMVDSSALSTLGPLGAAMMDKRTVPAVMVVDAYMAPPQMDGAKLMLPSEMQIKVELWKTELLSGLFELDTQGNITQLGIKDNSTFNPHLLLGVPPAMLTGAAFSSLIPLHGKSATDALFTEGALSTHLTNKPGAPHRGRGGMRAGGHASRRRGVGPIHTVRLAHGTDYADLDVTVQAVVKQDVGVGCSLYVMVHVAQPRCGRPDFREWLWGSPLPALTNSVPGRRNRRISATADPHNQHSFDKPPQHLLAGLAGLPAPLPPPPNLKTHLPHAPRAAAHHALPPSPPPELDAASHVSPADEPHTPPDASGTDGQTVLSRRNTSDLPQADKAGMATVPETDELLDLQELKNQLGLQSEKDALSSSRKPRPPSGGAPQRTKSGKVDSFKRRGKPSGPSRLNSKDGLKPTKSVRASDNGASDDDKASVESGPTGLKEGGRERIKTWIASAQPETDNEGSDADGSMPGSQEGEEEMEEQQGEYDEEVEVEDIDEAGQAMNEFKRGKRLKKLVKLLMGPQAQAPNKRLKWIGVFTVIGLIVVDLAMFIAFWSMVEKQKSQVQDLRQSSRAVNRVMQVAISTSALEILWAGNLTGSSIRHLGEGGLATDVAYQLNLMATRTEQMDVYHRGVYRGFTTTRQLPEAYNLRYIWEQPVLPMLTFYQSASAGTFSLPTNMSLWDAGNEFIKAARSILQTANATYGLHTNNSMGVLNNTDVLFILYNGPRSIIAAYQETLDGLMQQAIDDSDRVNQVQLIILAIEGGLVGTAAVITMWIATSLVVFRRFAIFSVFMVVPSGVLKGLATKEVDLEEGDEEDREASRDREDVADGLQGGSGAMAGVTSGNGDDWNAQGSNKQNNTAYATKAGGAGGGPTGAKINFVANAAANADKKGDNDKPKTLKEKLLSALPSFLRPSETQGKKRNLQRSMSAVLWISWPFMFWSLFVIIINCMGYISLKGISAPIAISNIVQFMSVRLNRALFFSQRFVSDQFLDSSIGFVANSPYLASTALAQMKHNYRNTLKNDYEQLRLEYDAMLFGRTGSMVANQTTPHFQLATTGIMFTDGADIMYNSRACFCQDVKDCQPPESPYYRYTMNGLDQMLKELFYAVESLSFQPDAAANMGSPDFKYIYEIGNEDITGGLIQLTDVYSQYVASMYTRVLDLHIVALVVCCALGAIFLLFVLRPNLARVSAESKRVAELLSQLPPEMDVERMLMDAVKITTENQQQDVQAQMEAAAAAVVGDGGEGGLGRSRRASMSMDPKLDPSGGNGSGHKRNSLDKGNRQSLDNPRGSFQIGTYRRASLDHGTGVARPSMDETGAKNV